MNDSIFPATVQSILAALAGPKPYPGYKMVPSPMQFRHFFEARTLFPSPFIGLLQDSLRDERS